MARHQSLYAISAGIEGFGSTQNGNPLASRAVGTVDSARSRATPATPSRSCDSPYASHHAVSIRAAFTPEHAFAPFFVAPSIPRSSSAYLHRSTASFATRASLPSPDLASATLRLHHWATFTRCTAIGRRRTSMPLPWRRCGGLASHLPPPIGARGIAARRSWRFFHRPRTGACMSRCAYFSHLAIADRLASAYAPRASSLPLGHRAGQARLSRRHHQSSAIINWTL